MNAARLPSDIGFTAEEGTAGASNDVNTASASTSIPGFRPDDRGARVRTSNVRVAESIVGDFQKIVLPPIFVSPI